jgi:hypothetical protein
MRKKRREYEINKYIFLTQATSVLKFPLLVFGIIRGPFEKFVNSPYFSESELRGGAVTVSFSEYLPWQVKHFLQRSTHFSKTCCRPFAASFKRIVEQAVFLPRSSLFMTGKAQKTYGARSGLHSLDG